MLFRSVIILFTDGENLQGDPASIVNSLAGIKVFVVGVGTPEGEPIPVRDKNGSIKDYKKDDKGQTIISRLDETTLLKIANSTSGKYFPYNSAGRDVETIADSINSMAKDKFGFSSGSALEKRYYIPLTAAFFFVFLDFILPFLFKKKTIFDSFGKTLPLLIIFCAATPARASYLSKGNRAFKNKDFFKAEKYYKKELGKKADPKIYYNLGNTYYFQQKNDDAEKDRKSTRLNSSHTDIPRMPSSA